MDPALLSRLQMLGANGGGGGGAGGAIMMAGYSPPIVGSIEQYYNKIWENLDLTQKQIMPGIGQFSPLPTQGFGGLLGKMIAELVQVLSAQDVQDAGVDYFANLNLSEEEKQKLLSAMDAVSRVEDVYGMQMIEGSSGWSSSLPSGIEGNGGMSI